MICNPDQDFGPYSAILLSDLKKLKEKDRDWGIFTRRRDMVSSNINSMQDRAEDPEKMNKHQYG